MNEAGTPMGQHDGEPLIRLLASVRENIVRNDELSSEDPALANQAYYAFVERAREIRRVAGSLLPLEELLRDHDRRVRCAIASCLLWVIPEKAMRVLQEISLHDDLTAVKAQLTIREWKAGTLVSHV
jgi:HEAT repeat protein